ncbi:MAG: phosphoribosylamine--glycine ligase [Bdellovibrio sp.]|nr:MAG: phosphoribosylamine--glycine ligase [Bdellovibrio sp.]
MDQSQPRAHLITKRGGGAMKVLVVGSGGREHALVHRLGQSPSVTQVHALPGNDGMKSHALCLAWDWRDTDRLIEYCLRTEIELVVIGPEDPLVSGLADQLRDRGLLVVGPGADAAQLEGSKIFAKQFMNEAGIPTAKFHIVDSLESCMSAAQHFTSPYVLKADGLCAGKGVVICPTEDELRAAATDFFDKRIFGDAGGKALLEQFTPGWELSYLVLTNGEEFQPLPIAQDHKRLQNGDRGPNTGGMGAVAPLKLDTALQERLDQEIVRPTLVTLQRRALPYRGFIFFGLMMTPQGPSLLEFNCRLGDPETQVVLPLIEGDFGMILKELSTGRLRPLQIRSMHSACVVMAAPGYPAAPEKDLVIEGELTSATDSSYFLAAGVRRVDGHWVTAGGRVLGAVGLGSSREEALSKAYAQAKQVRWRGLQMREDIGGGTR